MVMMVIHYFFFSRLGANRVRLPACGQSRFASGNLVSRDRFGCLVPRARFSFTPELNLVLILDTGFSFYFRSPRRCTSTVSQPDLHLFICVAFSSHLFWTSSSLDAPAGVTQDEGHTGFIIHLPSAVRGLIFLARRIRPFFSFVDRGVDFCVLTISSFSSHLVPSPSGTWFRGMSVGGSFRRV